MVFIVVFILFAIVFNGSHGVKHKSVVNTTQTINNLQKIDVPGDYILFVDRLKKNATAMSMYARQSQVQNSSSSTSSRRCICANGVCKCCTGYIMDLLKQKACMKVAYHPGDFAFDVSMSMNDRILYENSLSGKNPRPICISPPRLSNLKVCGKFYNVFFPGRNFHFCLAMTGQWRSYELFNYAFDCLRMGANGITMVKPDESGGLHVPNPQGGIDAVIDAGEDDIEDYDENVVKSLLNEFLGDDYDDDDDEEDDK